MPFLSTIQNKIESLSDSSIANPKALANKQEFVDKNLNRVYPGNKNSLCYEDRLACKNLQFAKKYKYIIDIHEANKGRDDFVIVPRESLSDKFPLEYVDLQRVLLWPKPKGPISQVLKNAIELEFGAKNRNREEMVLKAVGIVRNFIERTRKSSQLKKIKSKTVYYVYDRLMKKDFKDKIDSLVDFKEIQISGEKFIPLLTKQYLNHGIVCYKMKRVG